MAAQKLFVEVQDEQGNIYYVHTSSDVVFCADGETVEEKLKNATTEKDGRMSAEDKKKLDGIAEGANKYVHPTGSGNKHIPSGGSAGQVLRWSADGTAVWGADKDTTYTAFKAATSSAAGGAGLVPAPAAGNHDDYLRGDGKWGAASDMIQTFSQASSRSNIASGEANKTLFGKIAKWFADLGVSGIAAFAKVVNNGTTTVANTVLDGRFGKTLLDRIVAAEKNITTINSALAYKTMTYYSDTVDCTIAYSASSILKAFRISDYPKRTLNPDTKYKIAHLQDEMKNQMTFYKGIRNVATGASGLLEIDQNGDVYLTIFDAQIPPEEGVNIMEIFI